MHQRHVSAGGRLPGWRLVVPGVWLCRWQRLNGCEVRAVLKKKPMLQRRGADGAWV